MKIYKDIYWSIISPQTLFRAWNVFKSDKRNRPDVAGFERQLEEHVFKLYRELKSHTYRHGGYYPFWICDPKRRHIYKATVRDRVLHHAVFKILNPIFEPTFISTSFSCRIGKGTHKGMLYLRDTVRKISANYTRPCFVLKCDVQKFFDSVDHNILLEIINAKVKDTETQSLLKEIIESYSVSSTRERERERERVLGAPRRRGIPIGNLTSQLFANVYMNEFDQFMKHELKVKHYARYTDDFVIVSDSIDYLQKILPLVRTFLKKKLLLELHPRKVEIRSCTQGIDFLGYVVLPYHILVRTKTKKRMMKKLREQVGRFKSGEINEATLFGSLHSYLGVLSHADAYEFRREVESQFWYWLKE